MIEIIKAQITPLYYVNGVYKYRILKTIKNLTCLADYEAKAYLYWPSIVDIERFFTDHYDKSEHAWYAGSTWFQTEEQLTHLMLKYSDIVVIEYDRKYDPNLSNLTPHIKIPPHIVDRAEFVRQLYGNPELIFYNDFGIKEIFYRSN
jgi:hypothetical protein